MSPNTDTTTKHTEPWESTPTHPTDSTKTKTTTHSLPETTPTQNNNIPTTPATSSTGMSSPALVRLYNLNAQAGLEEEALQQL